MPIGKRTGEQHLVRLTRTAADSFAEDDLGAVMFVPLIGPAGLGGGAGVKGQCALVFSAAVYRSGCRAPFDDPDLPVFVSLFDRFAGARVVLLGEASHGTSEFYRARAAITRQLVERHGFTIVEADWPDAARFDCGGWNRSTIVDVCPLEDAGPSGADGVRAERSHNDADVAKSVAVGRGQSPVLIGVGRQPMEGHGNGLRPLQIRRKLLSRDRR